MITKEKKKILEPKRRCHMWESTFYFNVVVSKEICGSYGCPRPAMGRNMNCRYILYLSPHCNVLCKLLWADTIRETRILRNSDRGPIVRSRVHLSGFIRNDIPARWEKRQRVHLEEVSRWPRVVTQDLGGAGSHCGLRGTACCAGFTAEVSSLQGVSFFFFFLV